MAARKVPKEPALQLGLRLPSRKRFFRRGQELVRLRRTQTACPLFSGKIIRARRRCNGQGKMFSVIAGRETTKQS
ncbi:hypothetical protein [Desulfosudis oleivorans]|uniref:hypothetical protein n=1 Tax=Desulfosudis oleivorans TaxID=181663 RepID=UPI0012947173|nr:hypothetical protein [Desulfosudis oleivorans]